MLGAVPIIVIMPPKMDAKDKGINVFDGFLLAFLFILMSAGIIIASAAMLFIKLDNKADTLPIITIWEVTLEMNFERCCVINSTAPEYTNPRLIIKTNATIITAGCPNPKNTSFVGTRPITLAIISAANATISYLTLFKAKTVNISISKENIKNWSDII
jgi:hypothetical protein